MKDERNRVCPVEHSGFLDNGVRAWLQNPRRILAPHIGEGMTALDLGCGPGFFTLEMARMVGTSGWVIACDVQQGMLDKVREKIRGTAFEARVVPHLCRENAIGVTEPVDFALAFYVMHEIPDQAALFTELARILRPEGHLLVVEPSFHVSAAAFEKSLALASEAGFVTRRESRGLLSRTALLTRRPEAFRPRQQEGLGI